MNKTLLILSLLLGLSAAHAAPIADEPLPFDTKMPPRVVMQQAGVAEPVVEERRPVSSCKTVIKKVHGRKVHKEVCSKAAGAKGKKGGKSKHAVVTSKHQKSGHNKPAAKTSKKHKRR